MHNDQHNDQRHGTWHGHVLEAIRLWLSVALLLADRVDDLAQDHGRGGLDELLLASAEVDGEVGGHWSRME